MDDVLIPFTMNAVVTYDEEPPEPVPDPLPPGWVRIPVTFEVTLPPEVMDQARRRGRGSDDGPQTSVKIVPNTLRPGQGPDQEGRRSWQDFDALLASLQGDPPVRVPLAPGRHERAVLLHEQETAASPHQAAHVEPMPQCAFPLPPPLPAGQGGSYRNSKARNGIPDLGALRLGETLRAIRDARKGSLPGAAPGNEPAPTTLEDDLPVVAGSRFPAGTGNRVLDTLIKHNRTGMLPRILAATKTPATRTGACDAASLPRG